MMKKIIFTKNKLTGKKEKILVDLTSEEIAEQKANADAVAAELLAIKNDPLQNPLTPPKFHAMVAYIKIQTGQDLDALIRQAIIKFAGGDKDSLKALIGIAEYEGSQQYRFDHPLTVFVAASDEMIGVMSDEQRKDWWLQAAHA